MQNNLQYTEVFTVKAFQRRFEKSCISTINIKYTNTTNDFKQLNASLIKHKKHHSR